MSEKGKLKNYRKLIVGLDKPVPLRSGERVRGINLDNAATTPPFVSVIKDVVKFSPWYSSVHRGTGYKSQLSSGIYEDARNIILNFVKADPDTHTVIFVKNTTEGINKLSYRLIEDRDSVVLTTAMEHHSNDLPWRDKCRVEYTEVDQCGRLLLEDIEDKLKKHNGKVRLVTVAGASNVTGYVNDIYKIASLAHRYGAEILVDGAQMVPHMAINMTPDCSEEKIDYLVFSAHKMYAPFGIGVIVAPRRCFSSGAPEYKGGGTVHLVTREFIDWEEPPYKEEAGSPNLIGVVALIAAIRELTRIGMKNVESQERLLLKYAIEKLEKIPYVEIYGCSDVGNRVGIIPFNINGIPHHEIAQILSEEMGIAVRSGCFCAQPYVQRLLKISKKEISRYRHIPEEEKPGMVRVSFGIYNTYNEIDMFVNHIKELVRNDAVK